MVVNVKQCFEKKVYYGHLSRFWNPKMAKYIYGKKNGIDIIDVNKTIAAIEKASTFLKDVILSGNKVLFVAPQKVFKKYIEDLAGKQLGMPYVSEKWFGGLLTNFVTIRKTIKQIDILQNIVNNNNNSLTKKEIERRKREYNSKKKILEGILNMYKIPAAIIVVNVKYNSKAVNEAKLRGIPIIGLVDTNSDPSKIDYVIPTNDESLDSVKLILDELGRVINDAKSNYSKIVSKVQNDYSVSSGKDTSIEKQIVVKQKAVLPKKKK